MAIIIKSSVFCAVLVVIAANRFNNVRYQRSFVCNRLLIFLQNPYNSDTLGASYIAELIYYKIKSNNCTMKICVA